MSQVSLDEIPAVAGAAQEAASGRVVYLVDHDGARLAGIVPAEIAEIIDGMTPAQVHELLAQLEDAADVHEARAARENGDEVITWEQAKAEADL